MMVSAGPLVPRTPVGAGLGLIRNLGMAAPRYASYPTPDRFTGAFGYRDYLRTLAPPRLCGNCRAVSLYLHIPFHGAASARSRAAATYLGYLTREISLQGQLFAGKSQLAQLHVGGGTPACLSDAQLGELMAQLRRAFPFAPDAAGEYSIDADPRTVSPQRLHSLGALGFNSVNLDVQAVEHNVNRFEPDNVARGVVAAARAAQFRSVRIDLVYGLPRQTVMSMGHALARAIQAGPDQIVIHSYLQRPARFQAPRGTRRHATPDAATLFDMLALCIKRLTGAGYVHIGLDHFARPASELALAQRHGCLHHTFRGYSNQSESDRVACGVSAISAVGATYSQNATTLETYYALLDRDELPITRGVALSMDDALRRAIIHMLMCNFEVSIAAIEQAYPITFASYFAAELEQLEALARAGWLSIDGEWLSVTPTRRLLIRHICMVFDRYLNLTGTA